MQKITRNGVLSGSVAFLAMCCVIQPAHAATPERNAYFGNTHIHTMYSFDAFKGNTR
jgi:flagellar biosynthesis regulator FlbT